MYTFLHTKKKLFFAEGWGGRLPDESTPMALRVQRKLSRETKNHEFRTTLGNRGLRRAPVCSETVFNQKVLFLRRSAVSRSIANRINYQTQTKMGGGEHSPLLNSVSLKAIFLAPGSYQIHSTSIEHSSRPRTRASLKGGDASVVCA